MTPKEAPPREVEGADEGGALTMPFCFFFSFSFQKKNDQKFFFFLVERGAPEIDVVVLEDKKSTRATKHTEIFASI